MRMVLAAALALGAGQGMAQEAAPSGHAAALFDLVIEPEAGIARFRYVMPALASGVTHAEVEADMPWLCAYGALPELAANGWTARTVMISLSDRELALGEVNSEAVQFFEAFDISDGTCVLETSEYD